MLRHQRYLGSGWGSYDADITCLSISAHVALVPDLASPIYLLSHSYLAPPDKKSSTMDAEVAKQWKYQEVRTQGFIVSGR
jgi:hypothetical protein